MAIKIHIESNLLLMNRIINMLEYYEAHGSFPEAARQNVYSSRRGSSLTKGMSILLNPTARGKSRAKGLKFIQHNPSHIQPEEQYHTLDNHATLLIDNGLGMGANIGEKRSRFILAGKSRRGGRRSTFKRHVSKQTRGRKYKNKHSSRKHRGYKNKYTRKHRRADK